jgi:hypothetical protein
VSDSNWSSQLVAEADASVNCSVCLTVISPVNLLLKQTLVSTVVFV